MKSIFSICLLFFVSNFSFGQCKTNSSINIVGVTYLKLFESIDSSKINNQSFKWEPSFGLSCTDCKNPIYMNNIDTTINYSRTTYLNKKCIQIDLFQITYQELWLNGPPEIESAPLNKFETDVIPDEEAYLKDYNNFFIMNFHYPEIAIEKGLQGKCYLNFKVSKTGEISDIKVLRGVSLCPECDEEAIRLVKSMPSWTPGKLNGKSVSSSTNLCVLFKLE